MEIGITINGVTQTISGSTKQLLGVDWNDAVKNSITAVMSEMDTISI